MMIKTRPIPNHKATKNPRSPKFSRQKRRQIVKYDIEEWYKFSLDVQEKLCSQYHVILLNYLPFKRMKYRKWHKRIAKSQKMINAGISGISKASSQFTETMDGIFKGLDGAFGPKNQRHRPKKIMLWMHCLEKNQRPRPKKTIPWIYCLEKNQRPRKDQRPMPKKTIPWIYCLEKNQRHRKKRWEIL